jgi:hypothetical protein
MKKILTLSFLSLFLFSCSFSSQKQENIKDKTTNIVPIQSNPPYKKLIEENSSVIEKNQDYNTCMSQSIDNCQKMSFSQIVNTMKDTSACQEFKTQELVRQCEDMINHIQSVNSLDKTLCKKLSSEEAIKNCEITVISQKANKENNFSLCDDIKEDISRRDVCKMVIINKKFTEGKKDKKLCNLLQVETFKNECNVLMK